MLWSLYEFVACITYADLGLNKRFLLVRVNIELRALTYGEVT